MTHNDTTFQGFQGRQRCLIDKKGRVSLPSKFRDVLPRDQKDKLIVTNHIKCLYAYPVRGWQRLKDKLEGVPQFNRDVENFTRFFISGAEPCTIDDLGRILIPASLRDYANLRKDVTFVGAHARVEIWDTAAWDQEIRQLKQFADQGHFNGLGI